MRKMDLRLDLHANLQGCLNLQILQQIMVACMEERALKKRRIHRLEWGPYGRAFLQVGEGRDLYAG